MFQPQLIVSIKNLQSPCNCVAGCLKASGKEDANLCGNAVIRQRLPWRAPPYIFQVVEIFKNNRGWATLNCHQIFILLPQMIRETRDFLNATCSFRNPKSSVGAHGVPVEGSLIRSRCAAMVVSVSDGSPRSCISLSRSDIIFRNVLKSSSPFLTDCTQHWRGAVNCFASWQAHILFLTVLSGTEHVIVIYRSTWGQQSTHRQELHVLAQRVAETLDALIPPCGPTHHHQHPLQATTCA